MPKPIAQGDYVRVATREASAADVKSQLYFHHYAGLAGKVTKLYSDETVSVTIDLDRLPKEIQQRHANGSDLMRQKWLDNLSDEARNKLSAAEKKFGLSYTILVSLTDVTPETPVETSKPAAKLESPTKQLEAKAEEPAEPQRKTLADIEAEEQRHLEELRNRKTS